MIGKVRIGGQDGGMQIGADLPPMVKPKNQLWGLKCFMCGQVGHFQQEWAKMLKGPQLTEGGLELFARLLVLVKLNGRLVEAFVDKGCSQTLVRKAEETLLSEVLQTKCIHGDVWN